MTMENNLTTVDDDAQSSWLSPVDVVNLTGDENDSTTSLPDENNLMMNTYNEQVMIQKFAVPVAFAVIFIVGLVGNGTLIYIILRNTSMHTKPNVMIVSLAVGDFLLILVSVPFTSTVYTFDTWLYGGVVCRMNEFMQTLSLGVSVFTLSALSVDRFLAIVYPFTAYTSVSMRRTKAAVVFVWVVSILLALVDLIGADERPWRDEDGEPLDFTFCCLYPDEWGEGYQEFRRLFRFFVYFLVPVVVITTLYLAIACALLKKPLSYPQEDVTANQKPFNRSSTISMCSVISDPNRPSGGIRFASNVNGKSVSGNNRNAKTLTLTPVERRLESRKRVARVVLTFVGIFVVCSLPRHVYVLLVFYVDFEWTFFWHVFKIVGFCLTFIYSAVNPLALYFLNEDFRRFFRHYLFGWCNRRWRRPPHCRQFSVAQGSGVRAGAHPITAL